MNAQKSIRYTVETFFGFSTVSVSNNGVVSASDIIVQSQAILEYPVSTMYHFRLFASRWHGLLASMVVGYRLNSILRLVHVVELQSPTFARSFPISKHRPYLNGRKLARKDQGLSVFTFLWSCRERVPEINTPRWLRTPVIYECRRSTYDNLAIRFQYPVLSFLNG